MAGPTSSSSHSSLAPLLTLPTELLDQIIGYSRPADFDNLLLASRHIYAVGQDQLSDHKLCKAWARFAARAACPLDILEALIGLPKMVRLRACEYLTHIELNANHMCLNAQCIDQADRLYGQAEWMLDAAKRLDFTTLGGLRFSDYTASFFRILLLMQSPRIRVLSLVGQDELRYLLKQRLPICKHDLSTVRLTSGALTRDLKARHLEEYIGLVAPRTLIVHGFNSGHYSLQALAKEAPEDCSPNRIERLLLIKACGTASRLEPIFECLPLLKTFARVARSLCSNSSLDPSRCGWELPPSLQFLESARYGSACSFLAITDDETLVSQLYKANGSRVPSNFTMPLPNQQHYFSSSDWFRTSTDQNRAHAWRRVLRYNPDDVPYDFEPEPTITPAEQSGDWSPALLVHLLTLYYSRTLEHLTLTYTMSKLAIVRHVDQILHFRDFKQLKTLEVDTRILRMKRGTHFQKPPLAIPPCLADILPPTIEVVRLIIPDAEFVRIYPLFMKPLPRSEFPHLRRIVLRYWETGLPFEISSRIRDLQARLRSGGIELELRELVHADFEGIAISLDADEDITYRATYPLEQLL